MSNVKVGALIGKGCDPRSCNEDMWEDSDDVGDTELQNSDESSLPVGATSPFPMNGREEHMHRPKEEQTGIILETESITTIFPALEQCLINTECSINICQADE